MATDPSTSTATATAAATRIAAKLLAILENDRNGSLLKIQRYVDGDHDDPYMPDSADDEYKLLAQRAISNWIPLLISTPAQAMYVDSFRRGTAEAAVKGVVNSLGISQPEWDHWETSRLGARQAAIHRGAITYGHAFTSTLRDPSTGKVRTKGLSPLKTAAIFEDAANDDIPEAAITVTRWPSKEVGEDEAKVGKAILWIGPDQWDVTFKALGDAKSVEISNPSKHGAQETPITRFAAYIDLDGRTTGVVEPVIPLQDRINQTVFDLLVAQTFGSFQVRTVTGMAPPLQTRPVYEDENDPTSEIIGNELVIGPDGAPVPKQLPSNARRWMFAEDHEARFGTLEGTPLDGYISSIDMSIRHLSAVSQTPPHHLLGQIANLSAEALQAAETSLSRMVEGFRFSFGESWERVFRLALELSGEVEAAEDHTGEVIWRDMELRSLSATADALGKLKEQLGIPARGLWKRVPGATKAELDEWESLAEQEAPEIALSSALERSTPSLQGVTLGDDEAAA